MLASNITFIILQLNYTFSDLSHLESSFATSVLSQAQDSPGILQLGRGEQQCVAPCLVDDDPVPVVLDQTLAVQVPKDV